MSRFFLVVPRPVPTISRTVVSFATVYADWQSGSAFVHSTHVGGVGGYSTKITENYNMGQFLLQWPLSPHPEHIIVFFDESEGWVAGSVLATVPG